MSNTGRMIVKNRSSIFTGEYLSFFYLNK